MADSLQEASARLARHRERSHGRKAAGSRQPPAPARAQTGAGAARCRAVTDPALLPEAAASWAAWPGEGRPGGLRSCC